MIAGLVELPSLLGSVYPEAVVANLPTVDLFAQLNWDFGTQPGLIVGQMAKKLPIWLTPLWVIGAGIMLGAIACLIVYGLLSLLSFIPSLGSLPDSPQRGITASLVVGGIIAAFLCFQFVPREDDYAESLFLPLICVGLATGFGLIYGMWHRTRLEWSTIASEGIVPYLLSCLLYTSPSPRDATLSRMPSSA